MTPPIAPLAGRTVVLDPGHNGGNGRHASEIARQVPDGTGGTKACNTVGTQAASGYAEHEFTWHVVTRAADLLTDQGATVILTRPDDSGVGPCVNKRAAIGNDASADAVVSIHGDGAAASSHGFFCMLSSRDPAGADVAAESKALAESIRDAVSADAMPTANYAGSRGIVDSRGDLAGLNLSERPTTMCELGNMRSSTDAAIQQSAEGRQALAEGIADGVAAYFSGG